jgi:pre-mRNA-processing factor 17
VEAGEVSEFNFEDQRRTFDNMGYALDPSVSGTTSVHSFVGSKEAAVANKGNSYATSGAVRAKRRRKAAGEAGAGGEDEHKWAAILPKAGKITPSDEQLATLEQWRADPDEANAKKKTKAKEEKAAEKSVLHIGEELDYLGRTCVARVAPLLFPLFGVALRCACACAAPVPSAALRAVFRAPPHPPRRGTPRV